MKLLVCYGTRPEYIKLKPVIDAVRGHIECKTLNVMQHTSLLEGETKPNHVVPVLEADNRLDAVLGSVDLCRNYFFDGVTHVMVQGDTATAFMSAMAAFHRNIPVIHLEAGLRTFDKKNPYPEETYRQLISRVASVHLCPTQHNADNLRREGATGDVYVVGNTVLDNLIDYRNGVTYSNEVLVTLHRRENHELMGKWFETINNLATAHPELKFTFPVHPNPNVQKHSSLLTAVNVIPPMTHEEFISKLTSCLFVISDSGGIQEEAGFLGKKVIVCRKVTERQEAVGVSSFLCGYPCKLPQLFAEVLNSPKVEQSDIYGNGTATKQIVGLLLELGNGDKR